MDTHSWKRFRQAYWKARRKYLAYNDVLGVGCQCHKKGKKVELAIVVLATKDLAATRVLKGKPLPNTFDGFPMDVREPSLTPKEKDKCHCDPLMIEWRKVHDNHKKMVALDRILQPRTAVVGQVFVIEDTKDNSTLETTVNGEKTINLVQAYKYFRQSWNDDYDFVNLVPDTDSGMPILNIDISVFNDVNGIHHYKGDPNNNDRYDDRAAYGTNRLQDIQVLDLPHVSALQWRLHEIGHRWGAYVNFRRSNRSRKLGDLLLQDKFHWGEQFNNESSPMDYDRGYWIQDPDNTFTMKYIPDNDFKYCDLDLYLMGMLDHTEVQDFYYIDGLTPARTRDNNTRYTGTRVDLTAENIAFAHGWRNPTAANSPRLFRQAFVVLTKDLDAGKALAANVDRYRDSHTTEFRSATRSRAVLDTYLYAEPYDGIYIKDNASDTGEEPNPDNFADSPDIWVRNFDDGIPTHQDPMRGQDNYIYVRVRNNGTDPSGEITVNIFRANYDGSDFLYPQDWRLQDLIGSQKVESVPEHGEFVATFRWDQNMIPAGTGNPCLLADVLPIHRTLTHLHHVWEDRRLAQKAITIVDAS
jgi:hypothetical protein